MTYFPQKLWVVTYAGSYPKKLRLVASQKNGTPIVFPNKEAAKQYVRNRRCAFREARYIEVEVTNVEMSVCEHCGRHCPEGRRFCSRKCLRCEHESVSETGCDGICRGRVQRTSLNAS